MARQPDARRSSVNLRVGPVHRPSAWAGAAAILILSLICAVRLLGDRLYAYPENPSLDRLPPDATIVCLAGGKFRIGAAFHLYAAGVGRQLFIVGAGPRSTPANLARAHAADALPVLSEARFQKISVETESRNTIENAFAVSRFLQQNPEVNKLVLITSAYHMRRAQVLLQQQTQNGLEIIPYTPEKDTISRRTWWHSWLGIEITLTEYFKFLMASLLAPQLGYF